MFKMIDFFWQWNNITGANFLVSINLTKLYLFHEISNGPIYIFWFEQLWRKLVEL